MNQTVVVDGAVLNIKKKHFFVNNNGKVKFQECYVVSKNGVELFKYPVDRKTELIKMLRESADDTYYNEIKQKES